MSVLETVEKVTKVTFPPNLTTGLALPSLTPFAIWQKAHNAHSLSAMPTIKRKAKLSLTHLLG